MAASSARVRMDPEVRRGLLLQTAKEAFAERGYHQTGLAEIATRAEVSKTLLYHYYPDGRPQLYREVMDALMAELLGWLRSSLRAPVSVDRRIVGLTESFLAFFEAEPSAFRLLFHEPWGSGEISVVARAMAIKVRLATELTSVLASSGMPITTTMAASTATIGTLLHVTELWLSGQVSRAEALDVANRYIRGGIHALVEGN